MSWDNSKFDRADDPADVGWLISYWRIVKCDSGCHGDYMLQSRQFNHLVKAATKKEALEVFNKHVENRKGMGKMPNIKGLTLFLSKVEETVVISDNTGALV